MTDPNISDIIDLTGSPLTPKHVTVEHGDERDVHILETPSRFQTSEAKTQSGTERRKNTAADENGAASTANSTEGGESSSKRKRRRHSPKENSSNNEERKPKNLKRSPAPRDTQTGSSSQTVDFFVDDQPVPLPSTILQDSPLSPKDDDGRPKLLLPAHVSVFGSTPIEILPSSKSDEDEDSDFISYLDFDDRKDVVRYFDEPPSEEAKLNRTVCKNCGAEGDHKTSACPVLICFTCGARNEHPTRSCPISKICFTCGMKGHININCPNRHEARAFTSGRFEDCDRCGSNLHSTNECPTWWRLYEYLSDDEKSQVISSRQSKRQLPLGQGGEGYVADDEWCYNCGNSGHWGDDCDVPRPYNVPKEPSAFSWRNIMSGPFFDPNGETRQSSSHRREPRDWEQIALGDWGKSAPGNVGERAKRNSIAKMEKREKEQEEEEDVDDWFQNSSQRQPNQGQGPPRAPKKMTFGKSFQDSREFTAPAIAKPSLLARIGGSLGGHPKDQHTERHHSQSRRKSSAQSLHDRKNASYYRQIEDRGPRYKGGYGR